MIKTKKKKKQGIPEDIAEVFCIYAQAFPFSLLSASYCSLCIAFFRSTVGTRGPSDLQ